MEKKIIETKDFLNEEIFKTYKLIEQLEENGLEKFDPECLSETIKHLEEMRRHLVNANASLTLALQLYTCAEIE